MNLEQVLTKLVKNNSNCLSLEFKTAFNVSQAHVRFERKEKKKEFAISFPEEESKERS